MVRAEGLAAWVVRAAEVVREAGAEGLEAVEVGLEDLVVAAVVAGLEAG